MFKCIFVIADLNVKDFGQHRMPFVINNKVIVQIAEQIFDQLSIGIDVRFAFAKSGE